MGWKLQAVSWYIRRTRKPLWAHAQRFHTHAHGPKADPQPPRALCARHTVIEQRIQGFRHYSVRPRQGSGQRIVVYLHGGGYVNEIALQHWQLIARMADAGLRVEVPIYGLAPEHGFTKAYAMLAELMSQLHATPGSRILLAGDSAGGGLALGWAQALPGYGFPMAEHLTLISPWLDITCSNPGIDAIEPHDPWLAKPGALVAGQLWAQGADPLDPRLSPIHGPLQGLPPMDIYIGTHDILYPDVLLLQERLQALGAQAPRLQLHVCPKACHVYPLLPVPEGRSAAQNAIQRMCQMP